MATSYEHKYSLYNYSVIFRCKAKLAEITTTAKNENNDVGSSIRFDQQRLEWSPVC